MPVFRPVLISNVKIDRDQAKLDGLAHRPGSY